MDDVALCINEVKRDSDHLELLTQLKNNITDWNFSEQFDLTSYGRLLMDGEVRIKAHEDQKTRNRYIFVFNKVMIMCKLTKVCFFLVSNCFEFCKVLAKLTLLTN